MKIPLWQVDAFTGRAFGGNPAAVCLLEKWPADELLQQIAAENNLAETAFAVATGDAGRLELRWFTPTVEVDLCGHATLATAHVLFTERGLTGDVIAFETRQAGVLKVSRAEGGRLAMDFPARPPVRVTDAAVVQRVSEALGAKVREVWEARDVMALFDSADAVRALAPDMVKIAAIPTFAVVATARGDGDADFVARFFAPQKGVPEDPVTGSTHCTLIPYWSGVLGKKSLFARQVSKRGGELWCEDRGARVSIAGEAVTVIRGEIDGRAF